ncbi:ABC transporter maintaining OM lipid asymmetry, periplasmic binding protein MlaC [Candidatus Coxiella mudrowiae]|uniref:ABC transporter maintaining OM lipid asymmetry, periplasmic binding protein MlaC n=2 Tax=Candidatus Coxiella mudrowiae TaxID=2054173 RepID=A0ABM5UUA9_9COXI|nr:ABC transporter maintaining OM lipid asymmetry, periplasmic binding protein MlaC [Candidatus Coxiella mudrowiae]AKQ33517.1 ABC transporter maintaining OM lipid asymmetry, periplasmic binding protein MlaC [Candidatus Coxiella mudrowiae]
MVIFLKKLIKNAIFIILLFFCSFASASTSPLISLQDIANKMISELQQHQSQLKNNPQLINQIVNQQLIPHIDVDRMAGSVIGRHYWQTATLAQRKLFIREFEKMVVSTYSMALSFYDEDQIKFRPLQSRVANQKEVNVESVILRRNGQRIPISYNLVNNGRQWKVYDFSIEGISLVQSYRSQFSGILAQGGLAALLKRLVANNRRF